jgi:hypothetical protein
VKHSDQLDKIAPAFVAAQAAGNAEGEGLAIGLLLRKRFHGGGWRTTLARFFEKIAYGASDCWYWVGARDSGGYGILMAGTRVEKAHRVAWELFGGSIPEGMHMLHRCDVRCCVNPAHLFLGTHADNMADMARKGRGRGCVRHGEANPMANLTNAQADAIRAEFGRGEVSQIRLARKHGISPMAMSRLLRGLTYTGGAA